MPFLVTSRPAAGGAPGPASHNPVSEETRQPTFCQLVTLIPWQASTTTVPRANSAISDGFACANSGQAVSTTITSASDAAATAESA